MWCILSVATFSWNSSLNQINNKFDKVFPNVGNPCGADMETFARQLIFLFLILSPGGHLSLLADAPSLDRHIVTWQISVFPEWNWSSVCKKNGNRASRMDVKCGVIFKRIFLIKTSSENTFLLKKTKYVNRLQS